MKRDKLYTANKWNKGLLTGGKNLFPMGGVMEQYAYNQLTRSPWYNQSVTQFTPEGMYIPREDSDVYFSAVPYSNTPISSTLMQGRNPYTSTLQGSYVGQTPTTIVNAALSNWDKFKTDWGKSSSNPANQAAPNGFDWKSAGRVAAGVGASMAAVPMFKDPYTDGKKTDAYDMLDPVYHLAGGRESTVGNVMSTAGKGLFQAGASTGNGALMLAGAGAKILGGLWNGAFGAKWNDKNIKTVENNIAGMRSMGNTYNRLSTNSDLANAMSNTNMGFDFGTSYIGKNGWFNSKATRKANRLRAEQGAARDFAKHAFADAASQLDTRNDDMAQLNTAAYGGFLDNLTNNNGMDAINYGFLSDYLITKDRQNAAKDKMAMGNLPLTMFGEGGKIEIKHPGRLTELKKRTGKTEAELWAEGKPEVRKMITFARNARKWKKAYGGFLDAQKNLFELGGPTDPPGVLIEQPSSLAVSPMARPELRLYNSLDDVRAGMDVAQSSYNPRATHYDPQRVERVANAKKEIRDGRYLPGIEKKLKDGDYVYRDSSGYIEHVFTPEEIQGYMGQAPARKEQGKYVRKRAYGGNLFALGGDVQTHGADYAVGQVYNVSEEEANRLKAMGYEFRVIN